MIQFSEVNCVHNPKKIQRNSKPDISVKTLDEVQYLLQPQGGHKTPIIPQTVEWHKIYFEDWRSCKSSSKDVIMNETKKCLLI